MQMLPPRQHQKTFVILVFRLARTYIDVPQVDIKDLNISIGGRDILTHAELKLRENVHYVLVGRNGTGKSST